MFYDNKICDGCSEVMLSGEDIVVCPECGTPQHRECYNKNNECVNAHLHSENFDWRKAHEEIKEPEQPQEKAEPPEPDEEHKRGFDFSGSEDIPPIPEFRVDGVYVKGHMFSPEDDLGGATVKETVTYTQVNFRHYVKRFARNKHKKSFFFSWNWGAFFFGPAWFFYRKLYKLGAIFLALTISATIAISPLSPAVNNAATQLDSLMPQFSDAIVANSTSPTEDTQAEVDRLSAEIRAIGKSIWPHTLAVFGATYLIAQIIPALIANFFYRKKMLEDIKFAKAATSEVNILRYSLIRRGGVSFLAGLLANLASTFLPEIILSFVSYLN